MSQSNDGTRPLHPGYDLADLLATMTADQIHDAADRLRTIAALPAETAPDIRARDRLLAWADALDAA